MVLSEQRSSASREWFSIEQELVPANRKFSSSEQEMVLSEQKLSSSNSDELRLAPITCRLGHRCLPVLFLLSLNMLLIAVSVVLRAENSLSDSDGRQILMVIGQIIVFFIEQKIGFQRVEHRLPASREWFLASRGP